MSRVMLDQFPKTHGCHTALRVCENAIVWQFLSIHVSDQGIGCLKSVVTVDLRLSERLDSSIKHAFHAIGSSEVTPRFEGRLEA